RKAEAAPSGGPSDALSAAADLGIPIEIVDISQDYLTLLHHPRYGYGKNVNPCIDCRIHMFIQARRKMEELGAQFIFTGEVLGQRPMSQRMDQLNLIAHQSGVEDILLRPLSALCLPPTRPEREGWVDRKRLFNFQGRTRKPQMALAVKLGLNTYPAPAGGCCFLTDPSYSRKVRDLWQHRSKDEMTWNDYILLKVGRHLRARPDLKIIVGRNEGENYFLNQFRGARPMLEALGIPSPLVLIDESLSLGDESKLLTAARITARYSDAKLSAETVHVRIVREGNEKIVEVQPYQPEEVSPWVIT
ncbi:MAG: tRNA (5-methylaminomethyl-2-thiouridylate)-methyltransferase, partial [Calditrichota bacterium]